MGGGMDVGRDMSMWVWVEVEVVKVWYVWKCNYG